MNFANRRRTTLTRAAAVAGIAGLLLAQSAPGMAATTVAQANATAVQFTIGGNTNDSGKYTATHDGTKESTTGNNQPLITALGGQSFIQAGTLAQDATAFVKNKDGMSAACAGLAGDGATLVEVGDGECLAGGRNVDLSAGTIDLSGLTVVEAGLLQGADQALVEVLNQITPVLDAVEAGLAQVLDGLGAEIVLDLGAVQSTCEADPSSATGDAGLANSGAFAVVGGERLQLLDLPAKPAPNTKLITDLDQVVALVQADIRAQLTTFLQGQFAPTTAATDELFDQIIDNIIAQIAPQLAPLEENILDVTLNKQEKPAPDHIIVTALDLKLLPAAVDAGLTLLDLQIGRSECGPNSKVTKTVVTDPEPKDPKDPKNPQTPTSVPAGESSGFPGGASLAMLVLAAVGSGLVAYRRLA